MSESTKHTPGPWTIEREHGDRFLRAPDGTALMCDMQYYPWTPDSEADWNLIAAAPEMQEALEALLDFDGWVPLPPNSALPPAMAKWMAARNLAKAAITKARGSDV